MALIQPTDPTTRTTINDLFASEYITTIVRSTASEPIVGMNFVKIVDLTGNPAVNSYTYQVPIFDEMGGAAVTSFPDAAPQDSLTTSSVQITGSRVALRTCIAWDTKIGVASAVDAAAERLTRAVRRQRHEAVMALATSMSNSQGSNATENTLGNWDLVMHNLRAQNHDDGPLVSAMDPDAVRDLRADLISNAAGLFGATWGDRAATALQNRSPGAGVAWDGVTVYQSGDVPAGDTTGWSNFVCVAGEMAAIEMPVWEQLTPYIQEDASRFGTWLIVSIISGVGIVKQDNCRVFITQT